MKKNLYTHKFTAVFKIIALQAIFFLLLSNSAIAKTPIAPITIKGVVTDANSGETLPGVTVKVKGTNTAVSTNSDGAYAISAETGTTLEFSFIGYQPKDVPVVGNINTINVKLSLSDTELQEVRITTALGVSKEKRSVGYSVSTVKGATLTEARTNSFVNGLEGKIAGVNVSGVATGPNGSTNVVIRGISSITGSSQPLYVVNGIPLVNNNYAHTDEQQGYGGRDGGDGIGDINPDDIETISVLKGAAATALYGYRGSNGVILITTKKGKTGEGIGVEVNSNYVLEDVIDETDFQTQYGQGYNEAKPVSAGDAIGSMESSWGAPLDGSLTPQFDGVSRPYSENAKGNLARFYKQGQEATNTISFSKGFGDDGATRFSISDLDDHSYVPNAGLQRMTFSQTTQYKLGKNLALDLSAEYVSEYTKNAPNVADAVGNINWGPMFVPPNINITTLAGPSGHGTMANGYEENAFSDVYTTNPYFAAYEFQQAIHRNRFTGSANLKYTFDNGFFLGAQVADDYTNDRNTGITPTGTAYELGGDMYEQNVKQTELNIDLTTGKEFKVNKDFSVTTLAGVNYRKNVVEGVTASGQTFATPFLYNIGNLETLQEGYSIANIENESVYASADLAYKNYLYLTITGRNDWYSTLAPGKINYLYPSVSGSFVFSELVHIENMDLGKFRISYADVGGEADNAYETLQTYGIQGTLIVPNGTYPIGYAGNGTVPNSGLRPSSDKEYEVGTELDFFKNRLKIDLALYRKEITNSIIPVAVDYTSGYNAATLNEGDLQDEGIELELGGTPVKSEKFSWDVDFNGTYNASKVVSLGGDQQITLGSATPDWGSVAYINQIVGKPAEQIIAFDPDRYPTGAIKKNPQTGAPITVNAKPKDFGSAIDPWTTGITNTFSFDHFNLSFLIDGKFGGKLFSNTNYVAYGQGLSKETLPGRFSTFGTDQLNAASYYGLLEGAEQYKFIYDASFIKFRQIIFGYDFPVAMFHGAIHGLRLSFVTRNVFTIMKHTDNIDPESNYSNSVYSQGLESAEVPYSRTFGFNLNIKL